MKLIKNKYFLIETYKKYGFDYVAEWIFATIVVLINTPFEPKCKLRKYIRKIEFESVETYSGIRGPKYEKFVEKRTKKIKELKYKLSKARYKERQKYIDEIEKETITRPIRNINIDGEIHEATTTIGAINNSDVKKLVSILKRGRISFIESFCAGVYRDSIVFRSAGGKISGIIHICFQCNLIINEKEEYFSVDDYTYFKLKQFLVSKGHAIKA